jgi:hypothetical protein
MTSTITKDAVTTYSQAQVDALVIEALRARAVTPFHIHRCSDGHEWACNSPYCEDVSSTPRACVDHGGVPPITKGMEPWRGR